MTKLSNLISNALNNNETKKTSLVDMAKNNNQSALSKLAMKKGIVEKQANMTIETFARIDQWEKKLYQVSQAVFDMNEVLKQLAIDHIDIGKALKTNNNLQAENNQLTLTIAKHVSGIQKIEHHKTINKENKTVESVEVKTDENIDLIETIYNRFMVEFKNKFNGSKNADQLIAFKHFIGLIDVDDIKGTLGKASKAKDNGYYMAPAKTGEAITALEIALNSIQGKESKPINQGNGKVVDKRYFISHYGIDESDINLCIDVVKNNPFNDELESNDN